MSRSDIARLLAEGQAFADLSFWRKAAISGGDAGAWLQDLISADISDLVPGRARRSLLLSPTGRIRAEFTVARTAEGWLLLQDPVQPRPVHELLVPYVLSADVEVEDRTGDLVLFALPGRTEPPGVKPADRSAPSCLGGTGLDLIARTEDHETLLEALGRLFTRAADVAIEDWRVWAGIPRFGVDATEEDLPQEAGLEDAVAFDKGCYLGQEAVAKVRNLGHPRRLVLPLLATGSVRPGQAVRSHGVDVGVATSVARVEGGTAVMARVRWDARDDPLETADGVPLAFRQASSPV